MVASGRAGDVMIGVAIWRRPVYQSRERQLHGSTRCCGSRPPDVSATQLQLAGDCSRSPGRCKVADAVAGGHATPVTAPRNAYDHRLRNLVCRTKDLDLAARFGVPRSTARSWLRRGPQEVVRCDAFDFDAGELRLKVVRLERRTQVLLATIRLLLSCWCGCRALGSTAAPDCIFMG